MNQDDLNRIFYRFRIERDDETYPPYHEGEYLEEYFTRRFMSEKLESKSLFIPVHWTAVFNYRAKEGLGPSRPLDGPTPTAQALLGFTQASSTAAPPDA